MTAGESDARELFTQARAEVGSPAAKYWIDESTLRCTNAVEAARSTVELRAWLERDYVVLEARDDGPGFTRQLPERGDRADPDVDRGRGLFVVSALVDVLWATTDESMTTVRCARRLTG